MPKLTAKQAKIIAEAQSDFERAKAALEKADERRKEVRDRYWELFPLGEELEVGEFVLKASNKRSGERFSLKDYRADGHEITPEMAPHVTPAGTYRALTVNPNDERKARGLGLADAVVTEA